MRVGRSVIGMCAGFGMLAGGYVPSLWGAGSLSLQSLLLGLLGAIAGLWAGVRISES